MENKIVTAFFIAGLSFLACVFAFNAGSYATESEYKGGEMAVVLTSIACIAVIAQIFIIVCAVPIDDPIEPYDENEKPHTP